MVDIEKFNFLFMAFYLWVMLFYFTIVKLNIYFHLGTDDMMRGKSKSKEKHRSMFDLGRKLGVKGRE